jgi:hypothetical protein
MEVGRDLNKSSISKKSMILRNTENLKPKGFFSIYRNLAILLITILIAAIIIYIAVEMYHISLEQLIILQNSFEWFIFITFIVLLPVMLTMIFVGLKKQLQIQEMKGIYISARIFWTIYLLKSLQAVVVLIVGYLFLISFMRWTGFNPF